MFNPMKDLNLASFTEAYEDKLRAAWMHGDRKTSFAVFCKTAFNAVIAHQEGNK